MRRSNDRRGFILRVMCAVRGSVWPTPHAPCPRPPSLYKALLQSLKIVGRQAVEAHAFLISPSLHTRHSITPSPASPRCPPSAAPVKQSQGHVHARISQGRSTRHTPTTLLSITYHQSKPCPTSSLCFAKRPSKRYVRTLAGQPQGWECCQGGV